MLEYGFALAGMLALSFLSGRREIMLSACVVLASWAAWCLFILATRDYEPWRAGIFIDGAAAWFLAHKKSIPPPCKTRAFIAVIFAMQVVCHVAYGYVSWRTGYADGEAYILRLDMSGWVQLLIVGGWGGGIAGRRIMHWWRRDQLLGARALHRDMERGQ